MRKIQCVSQLFSWLFQITFIAMPVLLVFYWIYAPAPISNMAAHYGFVINYIPHGLKVLSPLSTSTKTLGFIISLIPLVFHLAVLYLLIALFRRFKEGDIFSQKNALAIKHCAYILLIGQLVGSTIYQALLSVVLTWHNPPGQRVMSISFTGTNFGVVLIALLIVLISWIMLEAYKIKEEQAYTI
jgi:hypothetical protein